MLLIAICSKAFKPITSIIIELKGDSLRKKTVIFHANIQQYL